MRNILIVFFFSIATSQLHAQCISGDCQNGSGIKVYPDSSRFEGTFKNGTKKAGKYFYSSGDIYEGAFEKNLRSGFARYSYKNGEEFVGIYLNDNKTYGKFKFLNGATYTGSFENNLPNGYGIIISKEGITWEGQWINGKREWGALIQHNEDSLIINSLTTLEGFVSTKSVTKGIAPRIFAVVIGIADYEGSLSDLRFSDDDARLFYKHLQLALPKEMASGKSVLLLDKEATKANIIKSLQQIFSLSTENDFIIFYFSGHGSPGNFCPTDYMSQKLSHETVKYYFKNSKARYRLCVADACFSGSIGNTDNIYSVPEATAGLKDARLAVIMSSKPNQTSAETYNLQQGVFSYYFIRGLKGSADLNNDSYITMGELFLFTKNYVSNKTNGEQVPIIYGQNLDKIPLARVKK